MWHNYYLMCNNNCWPLLQQWLLLWRLNGFSWKGKSLLWKWKRSHYYWYLPYYYLYLLMSTLQINTVKLLQLLLQWLLLLWFPQIFTTTATHCYTTTVSNKSLRPIFWKNKLYWHTATTTATTTISDKSHCPIYWKNIKKNINPVGWDAPFGMYIM